MRGGGTARSGRPGRARSAPRRRHRWPPTIAVHRGRRVATRNGSARVPATHLRAATYRPAADPPRQPANGPGHAKSRRGASLQLPNPSSNRDLARIGGCRANDAARWATVWVACLFARVGESIAMGHRPSAVAPGGGVERSECRRDQVAAGTERARVVIGTITPQGGGRMTCSSAQAAFIDDPMPRSRQPFALDDDPPRRERRRASPPARSSSPVTKSVSGRWSMLAR